MTKCFLFAQQLRPTLIEDKVIKEAESFLTSQQTEEGYFREPGRVIHRDMQASAFFPDEDYIVSPKLYLF